MARITVVGSLNYDLVTFTTKVPEGGETYQADAFENHLGGKGLNEAIATARLNGSPQTSVRMVGKVGGDSFGKELKGALVDAGVDVKYVDTVDGVSLGVAVILVELLGENRILITAGANGELKPTPEEYNDIFSGDHLPEFVMLQNEYPDTIKTIEWLNTNKPDINIAYNPSPFKPELINECTWAKLDLLIVNEGEAKDVAGQLLPDLSFGESNDDYFQLAIKLRGLLNPKNIQTIIITMGSHGCVFFGKGMDSPQFVPSRKVEKVVDTTGAGDTFFGGIISQLANGHTLAEAVTFATCASSIVVQLKGAAESIPNYETVQKHL
ncbi:ribokinase [Kocuria palustris]|nr:ribokinase [Kocuria palustris]